MLLTIFLIMEVSIISDLMINEQIRDREVRLISPDGEPGFGERLNIKDNFFDF